MMDNTNNRIVFLESRRRQQLTARNDEQSVLSGDYQAGWIECEKQWHPMLEELAEEKRDATVRLGLVSHAARHVLASLARSGKYGFMLLLGGVAAIGRPYPGFVGLGWVMICVGAAVLAYTLSKSGEKLGVATEK